MRLGLYLAHTLAGTHEGVSSLEEDFFGLAGFLLVDEEMLGNGYFERVVNKGLQHYPNGAKPCKHFIVSHFRPCRQDENRNLWLTGPNAGEQRHGLRNAIPRQQHKAGTVHDLQIAQEGLLFRKQSQII